MKSRTLGQKIRFFRDTKGVSQFTLELETGLSAGTISRIENDTVNPTKETILNITHCLQLNPFETMYVLDINHNDPSDEEMLKVKENMSEYMNKPWNFSYIVDNKSRFIEFSLGFKIIGKIGKIDYKKFYNQHVQEILFNPCLGFRDTIPDEKFREIALPVIQFYFEEKYYLFNEQWWEDMLAKLKEFEEFVQLYKEVELKREGNDSKGEQVLYMNLLGRRLKFYYQIIHMFQDPRFILVDFSLQSRRELSKILKLDDAQ